MNPLSIIATSLTIAGDVRMAIAEAQEIRHGKDQTHALANEVSDFTIMLLELEKCLRRLSMEESGQNPQFLQRVVSIRNRLNDIGERLTAWFVIFQHQRFHERELVSGDSGPNPTDGRFFPQ